MSSSGGISFNGFYGSFSEPCTSITPGKHITVHLQLINTHVKSCAVTKDCALMVTEGFALPPKSTTSCVRNYHYYVKLEAVCWEDFQMHSCKIHSEDAGFPFSYSRSLSFMKNCHTILELL